MQQSLNISRRTDTRIIRLYAVSHCFYKGIFELNSEKDLKDLVRGALDNDKSAFQELVVECAPAVYRRIVQIVRDPETARDLTQEVFLKVLCRLSQFRESERFSAWLMRVAENQAKMWH